MKQKLVLATGGSLCALLFSFPIWIPKAKATTAPNNFINLQIQNTVSGTITEVNSDGMSNPIPGVTVREKGTQNGTNTDKSGRYSLKVKDGATLVISAIGYTTQEIVVNQQSVINVVLSVDIKSLDEVVVTGYQKIDRAMFTGAAVKLKADDIKIAGTIDVGRMLEGRAAGVSVQNVSGTFGTAPKIRIRGATSIT
nr:carboxypeptidase-like regulatory domain-containing protein [Flectobacillus sp.]